MRMRVQSREVPETYQEYTSSMGGKIVFPLSFSFFKNLFRSKKSLVSISSFNCASQLSCNVSISKVSNSLCSGVNFASHFSLSNLGAAMGGSAGLGLVKEDNGEVLEDAPSDAGCLKKEVIAALAFGFLVEAVAISPALRLSGVVIVLAAGCKGGLKQ